MKQPRGRCDSRNRAAFTLAETIAVLVITGIMAIVSAPAFASLLRLRHASLATEIERRLVFARAYSVAASAPTGVRFNTSTQRISLMTIASTGAAPTALGSTAGGTATTVVSEIAPGASLSSVTLNGGTTYSTLWFDYKSVPHVRNESTGAFVSNLTSDATITTSGSHTITVRRLTGLIER